MIFATIARQSGETVPHFYYGERCQSAMLNIAHFEFTAVIRL